MRDAILDLTDIQGNILRAYAFPFGRYMFMNLTTASDARSFIRAMIPDITSSEIWRDEKPLSTLNIALSQSALTALKLPEATLRTFPDEFRQGMAARARSLGDVGDSDPANWEPMWQKGVDVLIMINGQTEAECEKLCADIAAKAHSTGGALVLGMLASNLLQVDGKLTSKEHFGYTDGISQPEFRHSHSVHTPGDGKVAGHGNWNPLETGDFIIGYSNEAKEIETYPEPIIFSRNGTFLVFRKLQQEVQKFRDYVERWGALYPGGPEKLRAKFMGRWPDGTPLALSPDKPDPALATDPQRSNNFSYRDDPEGLRCPLGAHVRRANPRDSLGFHGQLTSRRRIIRRGMTYGTFAPESQPVDDTERGVVFMALNANISRQFEFVQQQWINYGNDMHLGEDSDPVIGNRSDGGRYIIPGDTAKKEETFVCSGLSTFVTLRGGDYFFVPSLTALQLIADGLVDPR